MTLVGVSRDSTPGALPPGSRLGRYQIIKRIAMGGMAELYLVRHRGDAGYEKTAALKRVLPHLSEERTFLEMFLNEARLAAGLDHSNIVHVMDFGSEKGEHFMVMEYIHGRSVQELLRTAAKHGGVPHDVALTIIRDVAAALHYAHERAGPDGRPLGLVHRDVSPSNVLVSYEGDVKLVDFGIAKATAHTKVTRSGTIKGKLSYMAPEQIRGEPLDRRADVFALAIVAYELLTGRRCFSAPGEFALINRVASGKYERPSSVDPEFPEALEAILARGLARDREDRFETARELQRALEDFAATAGHRLSRLALSEYFDQIFERREYPTAVALPMPANKTITLATRKGRRTSAMLLAAAVALGVGVGWGGPWLLGEEPQREGVPVIDRSEGDPVSAAASNTPRTKASSGPDLVSSEGTGTSGSLAEEATTAPGASGSEPLAPDPAPRKTPPKRKRPKPKPRSKPATAPDRPKMEYLPPSLRDG